MKLQSIIQKLENIAPLNLAEKWDNVGLLINPLKPQNVKKILLTIDLTEAVEDEGGFGQNQQAFVLILSSSYGVMSPNHLGG